MLVSNSFDLWRRDAFFSAAEEVQQSADILESAYRTWVREKKEGLAGSDLEELQRELQTALGTAKWQLEEFERAVMSSYGSCHDQNRMTRHQQFVVAIESQISRTEDALRESLSEDGKHPLQWVNLDEDERDDLAVFLSGSFANTKESTRHESVKRSDSSEKMNLLMKDLDYPACSDSNNMDSNIQTCMTNDVVINLEPVHCAKEIIARETPGTRGNVNSESDQISCGKGSWFSPKTGGSWFSLKTGALRIASADGDDQMSMLPTTVEDKSKGKGFKISNYLYLTVIAFINMMLQQFKRQSARPSAVTEATCNYIHALIFSTCAVPPAFKLNDI